MTPRSMTFRRTATIAALALAPALGACDWFTDFKNQPKIEPWEPVSQQDDDIRHPPKPNPQMSVPVSGTFLASYQVSYRPVPGVIDSIANAVTNPTPQSKASQENGRRHFEINCAVCHGDLAQGNGPSTLYGMPGISLVNERVRGFKDGYIYGMMRNGRGLMPTYNRIEEMDRWDVVNYVRALQGLTPNLTGGTGPLGYPGQGGSAVPGYSATAPSLPAPMWREPRGAAGGMTVAAQAPGNAGTQNVGPRSAAAVLGELGRPIPAGINDSGPTAHRDAQGATVRPTPTAPAYELGRPSMGTTTPGSSVPSNGKPTGAVRGVQTTPGGRP
jgi:mono/diheme cytochrome c family protein